VFWVNASKRNTLKQSYKTIVSKLETIIDVNCSLEVALRELEFYEGNWLLLINKANNLENILGLWSSSIYDNILYTSKYQMLRRLPKSQKQYVSKISKIKYQNFF